MPIDCKGCNAPCCRHIGLVSRELDRGDGVCRYLTDDSRCSIYADRPAICNTDRIFDRFFRGRITREEFDRINERSCKELRDAEK